MTDTSDLSTPRRILAIHAHPDDIEFQCAGTLALLKQAGHDVLICSMTPGDCGSREMSADEIAAVRRGEAQRAAALLGAEYHCLEFRDLSIVVDQESKRRVTEVIRWARPDVVFTAPPVDYMDDHEATSRLVRDACFNASCPNYSTRSWDPAPATERIPHLLYVDPVEGCDLWGTPIEPHYFVDISDQFALKREMLACHESQRNWLRAQHGVDEYLAIQERWSGVRGQQLGVKYAEAFRQHRGHPYPASDILTALLGPRVKEWNVK